MATLLEQTPIATDAGTYSVQWFWDEDAERPYDEGFCLFVDGTPRSLEIREGFNDRDATHATVWAAIAGHGRSSDWYPGRTSGAALVRYLTLKGYRGVTLVDAEYRPTPATADRDERLHGVAWAPADAVDPAAYTTAQLAAWQAWRTGDVFGWVLIGPDELEVESCWGYYGFDATQRDWTFSEARDVALHDELRRVEEANRAGSGFVGLI